MHILGIFKRLLKQFIELPNPGTGEGWGKKMFTSPPAPSPHREGERIEINYIPHHSLRENET